MKGETISSILLALSIGISIGIFVMFIIDFLPIKEVNLSQKKSELQHEISILKLEIEKQELQKQLGENR